MHCSDAVNRERDIKTLHAGMAFCARCYKEGPAEDFKRCGKCSKRRFCSKECQKADWQDGHKLWCGAAGEIDCDYTIREAGDVPTFRGLLSL